MLRRALPAGAVVTLALALSACGGSDPASDPGRAGATAAPASAAAFNDADVSFAQRMIEHHRQAVQMAAMVGARGADPEVRVLATNIRAAQQPEIETMTGWLTAWGAPLSPPVASPAASGHPGMRHGSAASGGSAEDMAELWKNRGRAFDEHFLTMMITHHEGAVEMARRETTQGADPGAKALAATIVKDQQAEIATMRKLLARL